MTNNEYLPRIFKFGKMCEIKTRVIWPKSPAHNAIWLYTARNELQIYLNLLTHNNNAKQTKVKFFRSHFSVTGGVLRVLVRYTHARGQVALIELPNKRKRWGRQNGGEVRGEHTHGNNQLAYQPINPLLYARGLETDDGTWNAQHPFDQGQAERRMVVCRLRPFWLRFLFLACLHFRIARCIFKTTRLMFAVIVALSLIPASFLFVLNCRGVFHPDLLFYMLTCERER